MVMMEAPASPSHLTLSLRLLDRKALCDANSGLRPKYPKGLVRHPASCRKPLRAKGNGSLNPYRSSKPRSIKILNRRGLPELKDALFHIVDRIRFLLNVTNVLGDAD